MKAATKIISMLLALVMAVSLLACDTSDDGVESTKETAESTPAESSEFESTLDSTPDSTPAETPEDEPEDEPIDLFKIYQSNSVTPSGNNYVLKSEDGESVTETFRGVFHVQEYGELEYKFYFSNNVDSTYSNGKYSYRNMPTEDYKIISAKVGTVSNLMGLGNSTNLKDVTFDGKKTREVAAGETYWSDAVTFDVPEGKFLAFEWTVEYTVIAATISENTIALLNKKAGSFAATSAAPMPDLIGCKRDNALRVGFIGDSITMGVGAGSKDHQFWIAKVAKGLGTDISFWNLGLGYARANDMVNSPAWLEKAKQNDVVVICFGVNDINSGGYEVGQRNSTQIIEDIETIAKACTDAGAEVILFTTPPYAYASGRGGVWTALVKKIKTLAEEKGYKLFDFAAILGDPDDPSQYIYGDHPNAAGCTAVAEAFIASGLIEIPNKND